MGGWVTRGGGRVGDEWGRWFMRGGGGDEWGGGEGG